MSDFLVITMSVDLLTSLDNETGDTCRHLVQLKIYFTDKNTLQNLFVPETQS